MPKPPRVITNGPAASRAKALAAMTKAELIKTIKALDKRQTQLLNEVQFEREKWDASQAVATALQREVADLKAGFKPNRNVASTAKYDPGFAKAADELRKSVSGPELSTHGLGVTDAQYAAPEMVPIVVCDGCTTPRVCATEGCYRGGEPTPVITPASTHVTPPPAMVFPWDKPDE